MRTATIIDISISKKPLNKGEVTIVRRREDGLIELADYKGRRTLASPNMFVRESKRRNDDLPVGMIVRQQRRDSRVRIEYALRVQASPKWRDRDKIKAIYAESSRRSRTTGVQYHVDHIYPIRSEVVCGLHVHQNLRIVPMIENCRKSNAIPLHEAPAWAGMTPLEIKMAVKEMVKEFNSRN